jgi:ribonucleoside-diphosphate reductase alpha chain
MESLSVHHPDVEAFATIKKDKTKVTGANISVRLTDEFLNAVQNNEEYVQRWPLTGKAKIKRSVSARKVWHTLISSAHEMAEPGLLFWDSIIKESPADCYDAFKSVSTNPCAELPLSAMDACRLLCLNLLSYVVNPYTDEAEFDFKLFFEHSQIAARMMDDIVDLEEECINRILTKIDSDPDTEEMKSRERSIWERILKSCVDGRRCGLGITALGDALASLGLTYGSDESIEMSEKMYQALKLGAYTASVDMAEELGPFEVWDYEKEKSCPFLKRFKKDVLEYNGEVLANGKDLYERMKLVGRRNIAMLTIAPTGSVSTMTKTTSGVEPAWMLEYTRRKKGNPGDKKFRADFVDASGDSWMEFKVYHPQVAEWMKITGETDIKKSPWHGCCAPDLDWTQRVKLQSALQKHCDHSISSTVNLPNEATVEQVKEIYETAWKSGCKGITVYRDGCRTGVLITEPTKQKTVVKRPDDLPCEVYHISVKGEPYFVLIGLVDGKPYEVFAGRNGCIEAGIKTGVIHKVKRPKCYRATFEDGSRLQPITAACTDNEEALTRMISMSLRHGAEINYVVDQLQKTQGVMTSLSKAIARALKKYIPNGSKSSQKCGECGSNMIFEEGCNKCPGCGASKCS